MLSSGSEKLHLPAVLLFAETLYTPRLTDDFVLGLQSTC
jgi:hypothetical protein